MGSVPPNNCSHTFIHLLMLTSGENNPWDSEAQQQVNYSAIFFLLFCFFFFPVPALTCHFGRNYSLTTVNASAGAAEQVFLSGQRAPSLTTFPRVHKSTA